MKETLEKLSIEPVFLLDAQNKRIVVMKEAPFQVLLFGEVWTVVMAESVDIKKPGST